MAKIGWKNHTVQLDEIKSNKLSFLKQQCTEAIYNGFTSINNYQFGFNQHDQSNFEKFTSKLNLWKHLLVEGKLTQDEYNAKFPIQWKSKSHGVVELSELEFIQMTDDAEKHLWSMQNKYWQLESKLLLSTTNEEIDAISW